jgi:hypothetical protein
LVPLKIDRDLDGRVITSTGLSLDGDLGAKLASKVRLSFSSLSTPGHVQSLVYPDMYIPPTSANF